MPDANQRDINLDVMAGEWQVSGMAVFGERLVCICRSDADARLIAQAKEMFRLVEGVACRFRSVVDHETLERTAEKLIEKIRGPQ